jgi:glycerate-2-kinase
MNNDSQQTRVGSRLRSNLLQIFAAAIAAVDPARVVSRALEGVTDRQITSAVASASRIRLLAAGKAALGMARAAYASVGPRITDALVIAPSQASGDFPLSPVIVGAHPLPDSSSERAGWAALEFVNQAVPDELLLFLLSGGASSMMVAPASGISLADKINLTSSLMRSGAAIHELNAVRRHLSELKGGGLLRALPADTRMLSLVLSDVADNDLATIGSGPATADRTTFADAMAILKRRRLWGRAPETVRDRLERGAAGELLETVKPDDPLLSSATNIIVGDNQLAQEAAADCAERLGYRLARAGTLSADAECLGASLAAHLSSLDDGPICLIAGGEPVVTVRGSGRGGRAQHCALAMAIALGQVEQRTQIAALVAGTDGRDGPTDAAGAIVTAATLARAREAGLDPAQALARNDSYSFFKALGDLVVTGPTGTNVTDIFVGLACPC